MRPSVAIRTALRSLAVLGAAAALHAQTPQESVYFTAPNNKILKVNSFPAGSSSTVVTDNGTNFMGLVAVSEGSTAAATRIIVANTTKGGDIRVYTGTGAKLGVIASLKAANAVTIDSGKNVWAVNADSGGADRLITIPRVGSGYGTPVVRTVPGVTLLADVKFVASARSGAAYKAGDILVLSAKPAKILVFRSGAFLTTPFTADFVGTEPAGMAIAPEGEILVTTLRGRILAFKTSGQRQLTDFASLGKKGGQVAVGLQGGQPRVFATLTNGKAVRRYSLGRNVGGDLVGTLEYSVASNVPFGVGNASLTGVAYTPASNSAISVLPVTGHEITFDRVKTPGVTSGSLYVVEESLVRGNGVSTDCPGGWLTIGTLSRCVPLDTRGYSRNGSVCHTDGSGCFYLVFVTDTGAGSFLGSTQEHHFEEHDYGFETECYVSTSPGADPTSMQPRTFYATDDDDPAIVEGNGFTDISTGCNSHIGRGGQFSMFLTGWDARTLVDIIEYKVARIEDALNPMTPRAQGGLTDYITSTGRSALAYLIHKVRLRWNDEKCAAAASGVDYPNTTAKIEALAAYVASPAGLAQFSECPEGAMTCSAADKRNAPGELIARAASAAFVACGASEDCQRRLVP